MLTTKSNKDLLGGLHYTTDHQGKMTGIESLSTSPLMNELCARRKLLQDTVCSRCYSQRMHNMYGNDFTEVFIRNTNILTDHLLLESEIPYIFVRFFRFEAFGDLNNHIQAINYFLICKKNPKVQFALWSKNLWFIEEALNKGYRKPRNLIIVQSSLYLNKEEQPKYPFVDKVFTVYTKEYIAEHKTDINCQASCSLCGHCYTRNKIKFIREKCK